MNSPEALAPAEGLVPLEEARAHVLGRVAPLRPQRLALRAARGRILAEAVQAEGDVPPFANCAVDGYAVRSADTADATAERPVRLPVVGEVPAGRRAGTPLGGGEAILVFTGAPLPDGADAVVMVEATQRVEGGAVVAVATRVMPGDGVRAPGEDIRAGEVVFEPGEALSAGHLGVLAALGRSDVLAVPAARVGVLSTGDELVEGPAPLAPGQIRDSNRIALVALVEEAGWTPVDLGRVPDEGAVIASAIEDGAATCDAVLTSGGVSMGAADLVRVALDRLGDMRWMQIAIRPAKPFAFGLVGERGVPVFGLPGNPVSSMVSFELLARPALRAMTGHTEPIRPPLQAMAEAPLRRSPDGKLHLVRVQVRADRNGVLRVRPAGGQGSHQLAAMARARGLALVPDGHGVAEGEAVPVLVLREPAGSGDPYS